jgi:hypothetical protein
MTETERTALLQACAFASVFMQSADAELRGASPQRRIEAAKQLQAALVKLDPKMAAIMAVLEED